MQKGSQKASQTGLNISFEPFWRDPLWGTNLGHEVSKSVPMQRGARSFFRRSAPMQRGACFCFFLAPFGALCWAQRGCQKRYKASVFLLIFKWRAR